MRFPKQSIELLDGENKLGVYESILYINESLKLLISSRNEKKTKNKQTLMNPCLVIMKIL